VLASVTATYNGWNVVLLRTTDILLYVYVRYATNLFNYKTRPGIDYKKKKKTEKRKRERAILRQI